MENTRKMTATAQLPPVTLGTLDGYPVMRWMDMQAWAGNFQGMQWVHLLIDAYVGSYGHYFVVDGDITMLLDPALWEKLQMSMASQPGTLVPVDSCSINGVIIKPYMPPVPVWNNIDYGAIQMDVINHLVGGEQTTVEIEKGEYERLKAVERAYNLLCEEKLKDAMCLVFKDAYEVGNSHGHDQMKNYQLDDLFDNYWEERREARERP